MSDGFVGRAVYIGAQGDIATLNDMVLKKWPFMSIGEMEKV